MGPSLCWSDGGSEFVECGGQPEQQPGVDGELVVASPEVLNERVAPDHHPRRSLSPEPRIGLSLAFSRPWSRSTRLFSSWPVVCNAAGITPSMALAKAGARSVITSAGSP